MNRIALTTATLICLLVSANVIAPTKAWYDCDVNNDGKVDGKDLALVVKRYNTYQNSTFWDPRCDLNLDLKVDGRDIAIFAKYFGRILFPQYIMPSMFNDLDPWLKNPDIHFDAEGIPTVEYGWMIEYQYNPVTIEEYALALYHQYLSTGNESYSRQFMIQANWLVRNVNTTGNWSVWLYKFDWGIYNCTSPWVSGMTQGLGLSVLVRAYFLTYNQTFLDIAESALTSFYVSEEDGGVRLIDSDGIWYETYADNGALHSKVLNGFMFALLGIYEYDLSVNSTSAQELFSLGINTLEANIQRYDTGSWSYYDLLGQLSWTVYHNIVIEQLQILYNLTNIAKFQTYADIFESYT